MGSLDERVRGEDLLEQRGTRARQSDDEDWIAVRNSPAFSLCEELGIADARLKARIELGRFRAVTAFGALDRIATFVVRQRCWKLPTVFMRLPEREAQWRA